MRGPFTRVSAAVTAGVLAGAAITAVAGASLPSSPSTTERVAPTIRALPAGRPAVHPRAVHATPTPEAHFVSVTPCVVISTKKSGALKHGHAVAFNAHTSCGVPTSATSVTLNLTTAHSTRAGYLTLYASHTSRPGTRATSFAARATVSTTAVVPLTKGAFSAYFGASAGTLSVGAYVIGYTVPQIQGLIYTGPDAYAYSGSTRILSVTHVGTGIVDVTVDRDVSLCAISTTAFYDKYYYSDAKNQGSNQIRIYSWYLSSTTSTTTPIYIDNDVYLTVSC